MKKTTTKGVSKAKVALGIAAVTAAGIAAYYLSKPANRKKAKAWAASAKKEIEMQLHKLPAVTKVAYEAVVQNVAKKYSAMKDIDAKDIAMMVKEVKAHWPKISAQVKKAEGKAKAAAMKAKKAVKKAVAKKPAKK